MSGQCSLTRSVCSTVAQVSEANSTIAAAVDGSTPAQGRRPRAWESVVAWVEQRIYSGQLRVGDQLPAERELASQLGVSRSAVREAMRTLQASGVVRSTVGAGPAGGTSVTASQHQAMTRLVRLHVALGNLPVQDVTEVRASLESVAAGSAADRLPFGSVSRLRRALEVAEHETSMEGFLTASDAFHAAIAEASGNQLVGDLTAALRQSVDQSLHEVMQAHEWDATRTRLVAEHRAIVEAIRTGDPARAARLSEEHVRYVAELGARLSRA